MAGIMEQPKQINDSEDYVVAFQCGCRVRFLGETFHRTLRVESCSGHFHFDQMPARLKMVEQARLQLEVAKLTQPPR